MYASQTQNNSLATNPPEENILCESASVLFPLPVTAH